MKLGKVVTIITLHPCGGTEYVKGHVEVVMDYDKVDNLYLLSDGFWYADWEFRLATINEIRETLKKLKGAE